MPIGKSRREFFGAIGLLPAAAVATPVVPTNEELASRYIFFLRNGSSVSIGDLEHLEPGSILREDDRDVAIFDIKEGKMVRDY